MIAAACQALDAREAHETENAMRPTARLIALRNFTYTNRRTQTIVAVKRGELVEGRELVQQGCNIRKLVDNKFVRREDES